MELKIDVDLNKLILPLNETEYTLLETSLINEGCRDALIVWGDIIIDGHNRYEICKKNNISFKILQKTFDNIEQAKDWMDANQLGRRNLTDTQRQILIGRRYNREKNKKTFKGNQFTKVVGDKLSPTKTAEKLAKEYNIDERTMYRYGKTALEFDTLQKENPVLANEILKNAKTFIEVKREEKKSKQKERFAKLKEKELLPIVKKYDVVVIDPPWQMEKIEREVAPLQTGFDYSTMTIEEIKNYKLPNEKDCHVFMWITHKNLPHGFDIFENWKVKYVCCFVWHKNGGFQPFGLPQYNCEFVLYGRIGVPEFFDLKNFNVCFSANRTGHSEKPELFYQTIKRVTVGKRVDIFGRREIDGFDSWGDEIC